MPARKPKPDEKPQVEDFIETARKLGADESREAFERAFAKVTNAPARKDEPKPIKGSHSE